jgi:hypothetical protein
MAVLKRHLRYYRHAFDFPDFWREPFLTIGYQDIEDFGHMPQDFAFPDFKALLKKNGFNQVTCLDLFDPHADLALDLNLPVQVNYHQHFQVLFDIGSLEHVFDTKTCLEKYFNMVKVGGLLFMTTPINGYFGHGLHVFHPGLVLDALTLNGFTIDRCEYSTELGTKLFKPRAPGNMLIWLVAHKYRHIHPFVFPQQISWQDMYTKFRQ